MTHIDTISCGQGAPSLSLILLAARGLLHCDGVIVADTGWETDMLWNTGRRTTAEEFFATVTRPLAEKHGMWAVFVRSLDEQGQPYDPIPVSIIRKQLLAGTPGYLSKWYGLDIPLFGSNGGRLMQTCTSKWKKQAIHQELRRREATTATTALGLHFQEAHRAKQSDARWVKHKWPLLDIEEDWDGGIKDMGLGFRWSRQDCQNAMDLVGVPYLVTTECDGCPHKNLERWLRTSPSVLDQVAKLEQQFNGEFFLSSVRKPIKEAIAELARQKSTQNLVFDFDGCDSGYCFL